MLLSGLELTHSEVSLLLTDDREIQTLNRDFRGKDKPTDVLSFALLEGDVTAQPEAMLGDLVISVPTAKRQARVFGVSLADELDRLMVHGLLHLTGYDHENVSKSEAARMRRKEASLLGWLKSARAESASRTPKSSSNRTSTTTTRTRSKTPRRKQ